MLRLRCKSNKIYIKKHLYEIKLLTLQGSPKE